MSKSNFPPLFFQGSVKNIYGNRGESPYFFEFSDRYSIFDWGGMPDELPLKGESLAIMADILFRSFGKASTWSNWQIPNSIEESVRSALENSEALSELKAKGLNHHSLGLVDENAATLKSGEKSRWLKVNAVQVIEPKSTEVDGKIHWDYEAYKNLKTESIVPLEVIFRFGAPQGSSFLKRVAKNPNYAQELGLKEQPEVNKMFSRPIVEMSSKLEPYDRMLSKSEAQNMAALNDAEIQKLEDLTLILAIKLKEVLGKMGLELWDGKFEYAFCDMEATNRSFQLIDSIGPDELRILADGAHLSKEIVRQVYQDSPWHKAVLEAKKISNEEGIKDWKKICVERLQQEPASMPETTKNKISNMYPSLVNALCEEFSEPKVFPNCPSITEVIQDLKGLEKI